MSKVQVIEEVSAANVRAHVECIVREIPHRAAGKVLPKDPARCGVVPAARVGEIDLATDRIEHVGGEGHVEHFFHRDDPEDLEGVDIGSWVNGVPDPQVLGC